MGEAPPRIYLLCDDHSVESRRPTFVFGGQKCVGQSNLPQEGCASGAGCICIAGATVELSPELKAALGEEPRPEPLSVAARQEKLMEKLNLDGLTHWSPENAVAVRELVLAYHDVFTLESNELGCTSAIEHKICIENDEPFKEWFRCIPPPLLEEVCASL